LARWLAEMNLCAMTPQLSGMWLTSCSTPCWQLPPVFIPHCPNKLRADCWCLWTDDCFALRFGST
jgi:hypothetical protein